MALKGAKNSLCYADALYLEVNVHKLYVDCGLIHEIDHFVLQHGFVRVLTDITRAGWGDALYVRNNNNNNRDHKLNTDTNISNINTMNKYKIQMTLRQWQNTVKPKETLIVQNSTLDHMDGIVAASIGMNFHYVNVIEKHDYRIFQLGWSQGNGRPLGSDAHIHTVYCAISETTDGRRRPNHPIHRASILKTLKSNGIENIKVDPEKYFLDLPYYRFVISPEGNGIDCHRHYEALMAGCIPIVEDHPMIRCKYGNAPILYTTDYSEITEEYLNQKYTEFLDREFDFSLLFLYNWSPEEQDVIKLRGNTWCMRSAKKTFYK